MIFIKPEIETMAASATAPSELGQYERDYARFRRQQDEITDERYRISSKIEQLKRVSELSAIVGGLELLLTQLCRTCPSALNHTPSPLVLF